MRNEKLRGVFEGMGLKNVQSVISSGNIIFETSRSDTAALEQEIEGTLFDVLGIKSTTLVRNYEQIKKLVESDPFTGYEHNVKTYLIVIFLQHPLQKELELPKQFTTKGVHAREICAVLDASNPRSPDPLVWLEKNYGKQNTMRTFKTVQRILAKMS